MMIEIIFPTNGNHFKSSHTELLLYHNIIAMKKNLGVTDRLIRFVIFDFTIGLPLAGGEFPEWLKMTLFITGIVLLVTVIIARCPFYKILRINTKTQ